MTSLASWLVLLVSFQACKGQNAPAVAAAPAATGSRVGGPCETCELIQVGQPTDIRPVDTSAGWQDKGPKLRLSGTVYHRDGRTPARDVILYYWQTDHQGRYSSSEDLDPAARRHGRIRGWVKTGADGRYELLTNRPAPYPGESMPAHIHLLVKEPGLAHEYYVDDLVFDDDPLLTSAHRSGDNRGGSGIMVGSWEGETYIARHDVILGLNIPGHPEAEPKTGKR